MEDDASVEIQESVELNDYEAVTTIIGSAVAKLWDAVDDLTRLRPRTTKHYHVTIFGSSRTIPGTVLYDEIKQLARKLVSLGCYVVTGGGPGLMQAANEGASIAAPDHPERSVGIRILLPFEQASNAFVGDLYQHKTFFSRLHHFVLRSNAYIVTSGGIGTTLELMLVWQLLQVRRLYNTPLVLLGAMWPELVDWARKHMVERNTFASSQDMALPNCVQGIDEAVSIINEHYKQWRQEKEK
jgi:uncharacterized protein (TIGR00730 family)